MAAFHDALGGYAEVLAAALGAAPIDAGLLGSEGLIDRPTVRANAICAPAQGFQVLSGGLRGLEMRGVEHGFGHDGSS
jgi:hypothetical protein